MLQLKPVLPMSRVQEISRHVKRADHFVMNDGVVPWHQDRAIQKLPHRPEARQRFRRLYFLRLALSVEENAQAHVGDGSVHSTPLMIGPPASPLPTPRHAT